MAKLIDAEILVDRIHKQLPATEDKYGRGLFVFREHVYDLIDILIKESKIEKAEV